MEAVVGNGMFLLSDILLLQTQELHFVNADAITAEFEIFQSLPWTEYKTPSSRKTALP